MSGVGGVVAILPPLHPPPVWPQAPWVEGVQGWREEPERKEKKKVSRDGRGKRKVAQGSSELNENVRAVSREGRLASHDLSEVEAVRRSVSLHSRAGRERRPKVISTQNI